MNYLFFDKQLCQLIENFEIIYLLYKGNNDLYFKFFAELQSCALAK